MNSDQSEKGLFQNRVSTAFTMAVFGSVTGGIIIGAAAAEHGLITMSTPILFAIVGLVLILAASVATGWYLPSDQEIVRYYLSKYPEVDDDW